MHKNFDITEISKRLNRSEGSIRKQLDLLNIKHNKIIAIDSGVRVGNTCIGEILFGNMPIKPGLGIGKNLMSVGDVSIVAVTVDQNRALCDYKQYGNTKEENIISGLVCDISWAINDAYKKVNKKYWQINCDMLYLY